MYLFHAPHHTSHATCVSFVWTKRNEMAATTHNDDYVCIVCHVQCNGLTHWNEIIIISDTEDTKQWTEWTMQSSCTDCTASSHVCYYGMTMQRWWWRWWDDGWWVSTTCSLLYSNNNRNWMNTLNTLETTQFRLVRGKEKETHTTIRRCHLLVVQCSRRSRIAISSTFEKWHIILPSVRPSNRPLFAVYSRNLLRIITHLLCLYWI